MFISKEHEKASFGENSPGPASGPRPNSFGVQTLSSKKTQPKYGFGTAKVRQPRFTLQRGSSPRSRSPARIW